MNQNPFHILVLMVLTPSPPTSGKDGTPDSLFLFHSYKRKRYPVTKVQKPVPEMSLISPQTYKILH